MIYFSGLQILLKHRLDSETILMVTVHLVSTLMTSPETYMQLGLAQIYVHFNLKSYS